MSCKKCKLNIICKVYSFMKEQSFLEYSINNCSFFTEKLNTFPSFSNSRKNDTEDSFKRILNKPDLRKMEEDMNLVKKPILKKINCPTCKGITYEDDIKICLKCGKKVCSNCGTVYNKNIYCNECWSSI